MVSMGVKLDVNRLRGIADKYAKIKLTDEQWKMVRACSNVEKLYKFKGGTDYKLKVKQLAYKEKLEMKGDIVAKAAHARVAENPELMTTAQKNVKRREARAKKAIAKRLEKKAEEAGLQVDEQIAKRPQRSLSSDLDTSGAKPGCMGPVIVFALDGGGHVLG